MFRFSEIGFKVTKFLMKIWNCFGNLAGKKKAAHY
jgi:hypothetical protein